MKVVALAFAAVLGAHAPVQAAPIVLPTVTPGAPGFHYDYSIDNDLTDDLLLVSINVLPGDASLTNLFVPAGFQASYDSVLGIVDFLPAAGSAATFAAMTTISGFGFDSLFAPGDSTFDALTLTGALVSGTTRAPVGAVPEPSTALLLFGALVLRGRAQRRRRLTLTT